MSQRVAMPPVLVMEKDWMASDGIRGELATIGLEAAVTSKEDEAIRWASEKTFSLAIVGQEPKNPNPPAALETLKKNHPQLPILLLVPKSATLPPKAEKRLTIRRNTVGTAEFLKAVCDLLGIASQEDPGTTIPNTRH